MANARWIYDLASLVFLRGGFADFPFNGTTEGVQDFPDAQQPDPVLDRYDGASPGKKRRATQPELDTAGAATRDASAQSEIGARATAATVELILQRTIVGWPGMTPAQKNAARVQARADWIAIFKALQ